METLTPKTDFSTAPKVLTKKKFDFIQSALEGGPIDYPNLRAAGYAPEKIIAMPPGEYVMVCEALHMEPNMAALAEVHEVRQLPAYPPAILEEHERGLLPLVSGPIVIPTMPTPRNAAESAAYLREQLQSVVAQVNAEFAKLAAKGVA